MGITVSRRETPPEQHDVIDELGLDPAGVEARCLYCGEPVQHPGILWAGAEGSTLYLHGACAGELALRLAHDAIRLKHLEAA